jgi:serine/threonine protein kinase
MEYGHGNMG